MAPITLKSLFEAMVNKFDDDDDGLSKALDLMTVILTPPDGNVPHTIADAIQKHNQVSGENNTEEDYPFTQSQKDAIDALIQFAENDVIDGEEAGGLIAGYNRGMRGGRGKKTKKKRKTRKGKKSASKKRKSIRRRK
jgi:hypothetical protein